VRDNDSPLPTSPRAPAPAGQAPPSSKPKMMKLSLAAALCATAVVAQPTMNIVQTAQADPELRALVDAVVAGGLAATLSGPGPFTVFAPIDQAFFDLGDNIVD
jgi:uncharacterized surface protein with fasciclin (FAS1) repeats